MNTDVVKAFNAELTSIYDQRPPLSKKKIQDVSRAALKAKTYYKHVVFSVEKFLAKCKNEYKIPVLYVVDSIIRASKHQFKEKDVFGPRFLKNFSKTLNDFLQCPVNEQCRVVRTLNLWSANGVYEEEVIAPFKEQCKNLGIETDIELVERAVKGKKADMTIYGGAYIKKEKSHSKFEARTPPLPPTNGGDRSGQTPAAAKEEPSDEVPQGCISERELLNIMQSAGCDYGGSFSTDLALLRKAHSIFCEALIQRQNAIIAEQKAGNIKNLLSSQFDYSDEEDSGDESKKNEANEPKPMTHDQVLVMAENLVKDPTVMDAFKTLHQERVMVLNQVLIAQQREKLMSDLQQKQQQQQQQQQKVHQMQQQQQQQQANATSVGIPIGVPPPNLAQLNAGIASGLAGGALPGLPAGFPLAQGLGNINLASLGQLTGFAGLQPIVPNNGNNAQNILGMLNPLNIMSQPGLAGNPPLSQNIEEMLAQQQIKINNSLNPQNANSLGGLLGTIQNPHLNQDDLDPRRDYEEKDGRRKRSRSSERDDHKRSRGSKSKEKDRTDRERRKLGLPAASEGVALIASKTLWFGRLPPLITDNEVKIALRPIGEVDRITIISSKACAYVTMDSRKSAYEVVHKLGRDMKINGKHIKVGWAQGNGVKGELYSKFWNSEKGITSIPWNELPHDLEKLCEGAYLDVESLPVHKKGIYNESGCVNVMVPTASDPSGMELSSPQASPPGMIGAPFDPTSPLKPHEFPFGVPPPLLNQLPGAAGVLPQGIPNPLQFPMRLPTMPRPQMHGQPLMTPNVSLPPPNAAPPVPFTAPPPSGPMFSPTRGGFRGGRGSGRGFMMGPGPSRGGNVGRGGFHPMPPVNTMPPTDNEWNNDRSNDRNNDRGNDRNNDRKDRESRWTREARDDRPSRWDNDNRYNNERRWDRDGERRRSRWSDARDDRNDRGGDRSERNERREKYDEERDRDFDRDRDRDRHRDRRRDREDNGRRERSGRRERESPKYSDGEEEAGGKPSGDQPSAAEAKNTLLLPVTADDAVVTSTTDEISAVADAESVKKFEEQMRRDIMSEDDLLESAIAAPCSES